MTHPTHKRETPEQLRNDLRLMFDYLHAQIDAHAYDKNQMKLINTAFVIFFSEFEMYIDRNSAEKCFAAALEEYARDSQHSKQMGKFCLEAVNLKEGT